MLKDGLPLRTGFETVPTKGPAMLEVSPERKAVLFDQVEKTASFFKSSGHTAYLGGGLSLSLGIENDIYRDQTDVDVEMDSADAEDVFRYSRSQGYLVIDATKNKQIFTPAKLSRRISLIKSQTSTSEGPNLCEIYFFKRQEDGVAASSFLDLPFPANLYDEAATYQTPLGKEIKLSPVEIQLVYKACFAMLYSRPEDVYDLRRFMPRISETTFHAFQSLSQTVMPVFFDRLREKL